MVIIVSLSSRSVSVRRQNSRTRGVPTSDTGRVTVKWHDENLIWNSCWPPVYVNKYRWLKYNINPLECVLSHAFIWVNLISLTLYSTELSMLGNSYLLYQCWWLVHSVSGRKRTNYIWHPLVQLKALKWRLNYISKKVIMYLVKLLGILPRKTMPMSNNCKDRVYMELPPVCKHCCLQQVFNKFIQQQSDTNCVTWGHIIYNILHIIHDGMNRVYNKMNRVCNVIITYMYSVKVNRPGFTSSIGIYWFLFPFHTRCIF